MNTIIPLRAFKDNYIWLWQANQFAWVVDPGDASPVMNYLKKNQLKLAGILLTHHHADHSGGIHELITQWPNLLVYGSERSPVNEITVRLKTSDTLVCGPLQLKVMEIPGHTLDHLAFYNEEVVFCGDTLFSAGCGRVFEGTYDQMYHSLMRLANLPQTIKIYCGHEYTLQNLTFAEQVEPTNTFIQQKMTAIKKLLSAGEASVPSLLADELQMNPFLRCNNSTVIESARQRGNVTIDQPVEIFQFLREWKNTF